VVVGVRHNDLLLGAEAEAVRGVELAVGVADGPKLAPGVKVVTLLSFLKAKRPFLLIFS
jgi:hypothetical protein